MFTELLEATKLCIGNTFTLVSITLCVCDLIHQWNYRCEYVWFDSNKPLKWWNCYWSYKIHYKKYPLLSVSFHTMSALQREKQILDAPVSTIHIHIGIRNQHLNGIPGPKQLIWMGRYNGVFTLVKWQMTHKSNAICALSINTLPMLTESQKRIIYLVRKWTNKCRSDSYGLKFASGKYGILIANLSEFNRFRKKTVFLVLSLLLINFI